MQYIPRGQHEWTGYEQITGRTPDISEFCDFDFYDLVWYWRHPHPGLTNHDRELARWIGVAHNIGSDMVYWLMPVNGTPIASSTVQHVTAEDMRNDDISQRVDAFNQRLTQRLDKANHTLADMPNEPDIYIEYDQEDENVQTTENM